MTYHEILKTYEAYAVENGKEASAIKLLLMHFSTLTGSKLLAHMNDEMDADAYKAFKRAASEYVENHRPVQHLIGSETFFGYQFLVNEHVLIPRFETEELVEQTLLLMDVHFEGYDSIDMLDLGTGSGCIAITLDLEDKRIHAVGSDISEEAVTMARKNGEYLKSDTTFLVGDLFEPLKGKTFDIIISNPPYIPEKEEMDPLVKDYEPHVALFGGSDGLSFYKRIIEALPTHLNDRYMVGFEHAYHHAKPIRELCEKALPKAKIIQKKDMQGKDRMTFLVSAE
ncbi:MAG: peptide chain release factor N(5)-glutamine methyltransferase [Bacillota bacterium]